MVSFVKQKVSRYQDFVLPQNASMHFTIKALETLLESVYAPNLLKYFGAIDMFIEELSTKQHSLYLGKLKPTDTPSRNCYIYSHATNFDVCLAGFAYRNNEIYWQTELLKELLEKGMNVLCVCPMNTAQWHAFEECLLRHEDEMQNTGCLLVDIDQQAGRISGTYDENVEKDWLLFQEILRPEGLQISPEAFTLFNHVALMSAKWEKLFLRYKIKNLVIRNNHSPENSSASISAKAHGVKVYSFQHSVLSSMPSVCPTFSDIFYCYGTTSQRILESFSDHKSGFKTEYRQLGMWNQPNTLLEPNFSARRILLLDQECDWSKRYFGNNKTYVQLYEFIADVLHQQSNITWRVRLHFDNDQVDAWSRLAKRFPEKLELSQAGSKSFIDDLNDVSLVAGLFSTAICEAARLGYPVTFFKDSDWFYTPDLADFDGLGCSLSDFKKNHYSILNDRGLYIKVQNLSLEAAQEYYCSARSGLSYVADDIEQTLSSSK